MKNRKPVYHGCPNDDQEQQLFECPDCHRPNFTRRGLAAHAGSQACKRRQAQVEFAFGVQMEAIGFPGK